MMNDTTTYCQEDITYKQLCNIDYARKLLYSTTIKSSPYYAKMLNNYNKGCEIVFYNLANARKINNQ